MTLLSITVLSVAMLVFNRLGWKREAVWCAVWGILIGASVLVRVLAL